MIKLQDFAKQCGITDRQLQRHLKNHENDLKGHFERKGPNGTWLDDFACDYLKTFMKQQPIVVSDNVEEVEKWRKKYEEAIETQNQYLAQVTPLLAKAADQILLAEKSEQNQKRADALEAQNADLSIEIENKDKTIKELEERLKIAETSTLSFGEWWRNRRK